MSTLLQRLLLPVAGLGLAFSARATTVLSGHITHPQGQEVAVYYGTDPMTGVPTSVVKGKLDTKGNFRLELPGLKEPRAATFAHGEESTSLFLTPGDNLRLELDPTHFDETIRYTGTGANVNNYLAKAYLKFDDEELPAPKPAVGGTFDDNMRKLATEQRRNRLAFLKTYAAAHPLPSAARAFARQSITFGWANTQMFEFMQRKNGMLKDAPAAPAANYAFLTAVRPAQDSALAMGVPAYLEFLHYYISLLPELSQLPTPVTGPALLTGATQQFGQGRSRDIVLARYLTAEMRNDISRVTPLLPVLRPALRDSSVARRLRTLYAQRLLLSPGRPAPGFTVHDASGKTVSLSDYEGKVVYLDFWASWCRPCMAEVPDGVKLKKQFEGQDVVFLYVSIDDEEADWRKALAKNTLTSPNSVHGWSKGWADAAPVAYQVESIPSYFLIGRNGNIVSSNAPRPSTGEAAVSAINNALK